MSSDAHWLAAADPSAICSDVSRSWRQRATRLVASGVVGALRLNGDSALATEVVQAAQPITSLETTRGHLKFRAGHGRLVWHVRSFYEEEPETVAWLDAMTPDDVLWDVGANIGKYAIYAASKGVRSFAFEPEPQNFALLSENVEMNVLANCTPVMAALYSRTGFDRISAPYLTKGGAYNHFAGGRGPMVWGTTLDALAADPGFAFPTYLKIDVDGRERDILAGGSETLRDERLRGVLIELNRNTDGDLPGVLESAGFRKVSERSNWEYRKDRSREAEYPSVNVIFSR